MGNFRNTKMVRVAFLTKFWTKINFWRRNSSFGSLPGHQNIEIRAVNNMTMSQWSKIQKRGDHFAVFSVPGRTIWGYQWIDLDLSCPYLFFWLHCGSYSAPNDHFCFVKISSLLEKNPQTRKKNPKMFAAQFWILWKKNPRIWKKMLEVEKKFNYASDQQNRSSSEFLAVI